jgi:hypothetical protein
MVVIKINSLGEFLNFQIFKKISTYSRRIRFLYWLIEYFESVGAKQKNTKYLNEEIIDKACTT